MKDTPHAKASHSESLSQRLHDGLREMSVNLTGQQVEALLEYLRLLDKWNKVYNLTAVREIERMVALHVLDSLSILPYVESIHSLVDVGTGAGLPGVPLAIARPQMSVTMIDAVSKKTTFVRQASSELKLANTTVIAQRVESFVPQVRFDAVISRAFADLSDYVEAVAHLIRPGGSLLAMKGVFPNDEINRLPPEFRVVTVHQLQVPDIDAQRHLIVIEKS